MGRNSNIFNNNYYYFLFFFPGHDTWEIQRPISCCWESSSLQLDLYILFYFSKTWLQFGLSTSIFSGMQYPRCFFWHSLLPTLIWVAGSNQRSGMWCELQRFLLQVVTWDENKGGYLVWLGLGLNLRVLHFSLFDQQLIEEDSEVLSVSLLSDETLGRPLVAEFDRKRKYCWQSSYPRDHHFKVCLLFTMMGGKNIQIKRNWVICWDRVVVSVCFKSWWGHSPKNGTNKNKIL